MKQKVVKKGAEARIDYLRTQFLFDFGKSGHFRRMNIQRDEPKKLLDF